MSFKSLTVVLVASLASVSFGVMGCNNTDTDTDTDTSTDTSTEHPQTKLTDGQILAIYNQVNSFVVETTALVMNRAENADVRALAETIHNDHAAVFAATAKLAADLKIEMDLPAERAAAAKEHDDFMAKLDGLSGSEFDKTYVQYEVAFHSAALAAIKDALMPAASAPVQKFMGDIYPVCETHLTGAEDVAKKLGY